MTIWAAFHYDESLVALFESEVAALRFALKKQLKVRQVDLPCYDLTTWLLHNKEGQTQ